MNGYTSNSCNCCEGKALQQQLIHQLASFFIDGLAGGVLHIHVGRRPKLPPTVLAAESGFAVMGVPVFNNLSGFAFRAVHGIGCKN